LNSEGPIETPIGALSALLKRAAGLQLAAQVAGAEEPQGVEGQARARGGGAHHVQAAAGAVCGGGGGGGGGAECAAACAARAGAGTAPFTETLLNFKLKIEPYLQVLLIAIDFQGAYWEQMRAQLGAEGRDTPPLRARLHRRTEAMEVI
jgi:hypothetical protein